MDKDLYILLIYKRLKNEISDKERVDLDAWIQADPEHEAIAQNLENEWHLSGNYEPNIHLDLEEEFSFLEDRINTYESTKESIEPEVKTISLPNKNKNKSRMAWAASIALFIVAGFWIYNSSMPKENWTQYATSSGEKKKIELIDGTIIWLNENSSLQYPDKFLGNERNVKLDGEAFFDVMRKTSQPFSIESPSMKTTVLGTSFNLKDYDTEEIASVAVVSGKVKFEELKNEASHIILSKSEKGSFLKSSNMLVKQKQNNINSNSWQTGELNFKNTPFTQAVQEIENHFDIEINSDESLNDCKFNSVLKNPKIENILNNISEVYGTQVKKQGDIYVLEGGSCK